MKEEEERLEAEAKALAKKKKKKWTSHLSLLRSYLERKKVVYEDYELKSVRLLNYNSQL